MRLLILSLWTKKKNKWLQACLGEPKCLRTLSLSLCVYSHRMVCECTLCVCDKEKGSHREPEKQQDCEWRRQTHLFLIKVETKVNFKSKPNQSKKMIHSLCCFSVYVVDDWGGSLVVTTSTTGCYWLLHIRKNRPTLHHPVWTISFNTILF